MRGSVALSLALALAAPSAARSESPSLAERVGAHLEANRAELAQSPGHYRLVFPLAPAALDDFMQQIVLRSDGADLVPGSVYGNELHGGGVLALLADAWRPNGRAAALTDRYPFPFVAEPVALGTLHESHKRQVFLPERGLPRIRQRIAEGGRSQSSEVDSYAWLGVLARLEPDLAATWTTRAGQTLSGHRLLRRSWEHYASDAPGGGDHSQLHLVPVLLEYARRPDVDLDPNELKRRLLRVELAQSDFGAFEPAEALGHHAEALGLLLAAEDVSFDADEHAQAAAWVAGLDASFPQLEGIDPGYLAHLLRGLRLIEASLARAPDGATLGGARR